MCRITTTSNFWNQNTAEVKNSRLFLVLVKSRLAWTKKVVFCFTIQNDGVLTDHHEKVFSARQSSGRYRASDITETTILMEHKA